MKSLAFGLLLISASAMAGDTARIDGRLSAGPVGVTVEAPWRRRAYRGASRADFDSF